MEIIIEREILQKCYTLHYNNTNIHIINKNLSIENKENLIQKLTGGNHATYTENEIREMESDNIYREESVNREISTEIENVLD